MKLKSILLIGFSILFLSTITSCDDSTFEEGENDASNTEIPKKIVDFLIQYQTCFSLIIDGKQIDVLINEETGEIITNDEVDNTGDFSTIDFSDTPFPIIVILKEETKKTLISDVKELLYIIDNCEKKEKGKNKINKEILDDYKNCFIVFDTRLVDGRSKKNLSDLSKNESNDLNDLIYPFTIQYKDKKVKIDDKEVIKDIIEKCSKDNDDRDRDNN